MSKEASHSVQGTKAVVALTLQMQQEASELLDAVKLPEEVGLQTKVEDEEVLAKMKPVLLMLQYCSCTQKMNK